MMSLVLSSKPCVLGLSVVRGKENCWKQLVTVVHEVNCCSCESGNVSSFLWYVEKVVECRNLG
jgi:hypothetical protein